MMGTAMSQPVPANPYLTGHFAPISFEGDAADLPIRGEMPTDLTGSLYRNGPNPQFAPRDAGYHFFFGDGIRRHSSLRGTGISQVR